MEPEVEGGTLTPTTAEPKQEETYFFTPPGRLLLLTG